MGRRILAILLLLLAVSILIVTPILAFTSPGKQILVTSGLIPPTPTPRPSPTPIPPTPTPLPPLPPVLTAQGPPPTLSATALYLVDADTGHVLANINGEKPLPMASTTKVMTALIAIQTGNLDQMVTVKQDAIAEVINGGGSKADLKPGEQYTLRELLYGLMLPSGDDAAIAIADGLAGSPDKFAERMNLFAYRLHLFQTHYTNPDGLTLDNTNLVHYTTTADLVRLAEYAMKNPLFTQIVRTKTYYDPPGVRHAAHTWTNTNTPLLTTYTGMLGIKTGFTGDAGACLVFAATRNGHHLFGAVLHSVNKAANNETDDQIQRNKDVAKLLDWGFSLPLLPPTQ